MKIVTTKMVPQDLVEQELAEYDVVQGPDGNAWSRDEIIPHLTTAQGLVSWGFVPIDAALLDHGPDLRVVANIAAGVNNLDLAELTRRGIWATNVPDVFAAPTAEVAMGLMISLMRRMSEGERYIRAGHWKQVEPGRFDGPTLAGKRLGLVGFGRIAKEVARRARAFGMEVRYTRRSDVRDPLADELGATYRPLDQLLAEVDVLSLHTPLNADTKHLIDTDALARMKSSAFLVNTARGTVVDQEALAEALEQGRLAGAALDVFAEEPQVPERLLRLPNVVVSPHVGGASIEARREAQRQALENVRLVLEGREPRSPVNQVSRT